MSLEIGQRAKVLGGKIEQRAFGIQVDLNRPHYDYDEAMKKWQSIRSDLQGVSSEALEITADRISNAFTAYKEGKDGGDVAFFIQPRGSYKDPKTLYGDIGDYLPALKNVGPEVRHELFYRLPPFQVAEYTYSYDGKQGKGSVVCVPLSVDRMMGAYEAGKNDSDRRRRVGLYSQPIIIDTARFAQDKLGIRSVGLGETMAAMTHYGSDIEKRLPRIKVTTGHAGTTWLIDKTILEAASMGGVNLQEEVVGIIGCGSIGRAAALNLDGRVGGYVLCDINPTTAKKLKEILEEKFNGIKVDIAENAEDLCAKTRFIIGAASNLEPILTRDIIQPGTIIIDDSQPVTGRREEVEAAGGVVVWPIAQMPPYINRVGYNFGPQGVLLGTGWGCELEALTLHLTDNMGGDRRVNHRVTNEDVAYVGGLAEGLGFGVSDPLQSFGKSITNEQWERIQEHRTK